MKKIKQLLSMLAAAVMLLSMPGVGSLTAKAAEPVHYIVQYDSDDHDWRYRIDTDEESSENYFRELYYLNQVIKDGDVVAVYYDGSAPSNPTLNLGSVRLSNLTIAQSAGFCIVNVGGTTDCFVLGGNSCSINGDITNAYVYDTAVCNFGGNIRELRLTSETDDIASTIGCSGTVGHFYASCTTHINYDLYSFKADTFSLQNGVLHTTDNNYSYNATSQPAPTSAPAQSTQQPSSQQPSQSSGSSSGEYDSVPKTGDTGAGIIRWLLCLAAVCTAGSLGITLNAKARRK